VHWLCLRPLILQTGGEYAPFLIPTYTSVNGRDTNLYFVMSTWNPYQVVLMRTTATKNLRCHLRSQIQATLTRGWDLLRGKWNFSLAPGDTPFSASCYNTRPSILFGCPCNCRSESPTLASFADWDSITIGGKFQMLTSMRRTLSWRRSTRRDSVDRRWGQ